MITRLAAWLGWTRCDTLHFDTEHAAWYVASTRWVRTSKL